MSGNTVMLQVSTQGYGWQGDYAVIREYIELQGVVESCRRVPLQN